MYILKFHEGRIEYVDPQEFIIGVFNSFEELKKASKTIKVERRKLDLINEDDKDYDDKLMHYGENEICFLSYKEVNSDINIFVYPEELINLVDD